MEGHDLGSNRSGHYEESSFLPAGGNFYNYVNKELEELIILYLSAQDASSRKNYAEMIQRTIHDDLPVIPIVYPDFQWMVNKNLLGLNLYFLSAGKLEWNEISGILVTTNTSSVPIQPLVIFLALLSLGRWRKIGRLDF